jgi:hypothetical protein
MFQQGAETSASLRQAMRVIRPLRQRDLSLLSAARVLCGGDLTRQVVRGFPVLGILQNDAAPMMIDDPPFFDLLQGSKAAQTGVVIV